MCPLKLVDVCFSTILLYLLLLLNISILTCASGYLKNTFLYIFQEPLEVLAFDELLF